MVMADTSDRIGNTVSVAPVGEPHVRDSTHPDCGQVRVRHVSGPATFRTLGKPAPRLAAEGSAK